MHSMIASSRAPPPMQQWRQQIGSRTSRRTSLGARPFAVISYLVRDQFVGGEMIHLSRLTIVALFDEPTPGGELSTRLVGVRGRQTSRGLRFGGPGLTRFDKDLRLSPAVGGAGPRLDARRVELITTALALERYLERSARHPYIRRRKMPLLPSAVLRDDGVFVRRSMLRKAAADQADLTH
jgi:hypothetical protein